MGAVGRGVDVSVVIPVYDTPADLLRRCLGSITRQLGDHTLEVVVCDDASPRRPFDRLQRLAEDVLAPHRDRVELVLTRHQERARPSAARNTAVAESSGEFLLWLDSDDVLPPGSVRRLLDRARADSAPLVISECKVVEETHEVDDRDPAPYLRLARDHVGTLDDPLAQVVFSVQAQLVRREIFLETGGFDPGRQWAEVTDLFLRLVSAVGVDRVAVEPFIGYHYRRRSRSWSAMHRDEFERNRLEVLTDYANRHLVRTGDDGPGELKRYARSSDGAMHYRFRDADGKWLFPTFHDKFEYLDPVS